MILTFHKVQAGKRQRGDAFVSTWVFVAAYILMWASAGVVAYAGALAAEAIAARAALSPVTAARIGGVVLVAAGIYQLTPLKDLCLSKCRTPTTFIMTSWREGIAGALRMGLAPRCLLPWLLLASFRHPVSTRHNEYCSNGYYHAGHFRRENAALGSPCTSRRSCCPCALRCGGDYDPRAPSHFPKK
jgi:hypothetical protein